MRRQLLETGHITNTLDGRDTPKQVDVDVGVEFTKCISVFITFNGKFSSFLVWGKPENISWVDFLSKRPIKQLYQATSLGFLVVLSV